MKFVSAGLRHLNHERMVFRYDSDAGFVEKITRRYWWRLLFSMRWRKLMNYALARLGILLELSRPLAKPYFASLEATNACQLRCPFCFRPAGQPVSYLSLRIFSRVMERFGPWLVKVELHKNGEPLLHPQIVDMIRMASSYGVDTSISSNMNKLPPGGAEALVGSGLAWLTASIDGISQASYEKYRQGGRLDAALSNLQAVVDAKKKLSSSTPHILWQFVVFRHNQGEIADAVELARKIGVDQIQFAPGYVPDEVPEWKSTLPEFQFFCCSNHDTCVWPWGGINMFADGTFTLCGWDERHAGADAGDSGAFFEESWHSHDFIRARKLVAARVKKGTDRIIPGEQHPCARCNMLGKLNFVYY